MTLRSSVRAALAIAALAASLAACLGNDALAPDTPVTILPALELPPYDSLAGATLAFQRFGTTAGNFRGVYVVNGGTNRTQSLLSGRALDRSQLSPDGTVLLYGGTTEVGSSVFDDFTTRLADSVETRLTSGVETESYPGWAPGGTSFYHAYRGNGKTVIVRRPIATATPRDTLTLLDSGGYQWNVDSPVSVHPSTGRLLVVIRSLGWSIWAMDFDGGNRVRLRYDARSELGPIYQGASWSPDGSKIAFMEVNYNVADQMVSTSLKLMNPDGTGEGTTVTINTLPFQFSSTALNDFSLCWLGANRIAFSALGNDRASHVWVARTGPVTLTQVTTNSGVFDRGVSCKP